MENNEPKTSDFLPDDLGLNPAGCNHSIYPGKPWPASVTTLALRTRYCPECGTKNLSGLRGCAGCAARELADLAYQFCPDSAQLAYVVTLRKEAGFSASPSSGEPERPPVRTFLGIAPNLTAGLGSTEYVRRLRDKLDGR